MSGAHGAAASLPEPKHPSGAEPRAGAGSAAELLRLLLSREGAYRRRWRSEVRRASPSDPHQSAVAQVLAQHLWEIGEAPESDGDLPRRLKDVVARALGGRGISHQTLSWFVGAFDMSAADERRLWARLEADLRSARPLSHPVRARTADPPARWRPEPLVAGYRTQSLLERLEVGADRSRRRHTLVHVVQAQTVLERVSYALDAAPEQVQVPRGGAAGPVVADPELGGFRVDIALPAPLQPGQTRALEATAVYRPGGLAVHHVRRRLRAGAGGVSLEVCFHAGAVPREVRWTELMAQAPTELLSQRVSLSGDHAVHRFLTPAHDCTVGFEWDW